MMNQAFSEGLEITIVTTYLREEFIEAAQALIERLVSWCCENHTVVEMVVNDWGMAKLLEHARGQIKPVMGILLNKRRKDPRYQYKAGYQKFVDQLGQNSLNGSDYRKYLFDSFGMERFEFESCGYPILLPESKNSLHFPYYQTNTSQYCTLYAKCVNQDRGKQILVRHCPVYCENLFFRYPSHLKMAGRYNSIFGMDDTLLGDGSQLEQYLRHGVDRLVLSLI